MPEHNDNESETEIEFLLGSNPQDRDEFYKDLHELEENDLDLA